MVGRTCLFPNSFRWLGAVALLLYIGDDVLQGARSIIHKVRQLCTLNKGNLGTHMRANF